MVTPMVGRPQKIGATLMIALFALSGLAAAEPLALVTGDGGGQAQGQAEGGYHADASGAVDEAAAAEGEIHDRATSDLRNANNAATQAEWTAYQQAKAAQLPEKPACECDDVFSELEQKGTLSASHADEVEKAADLESEYVDAGADVGASGQASAWFSDLFTGAEDLYNQAKGLVGLETNARDQVEDASDQVLRSEGELRGEVVSTVSQDHDLPDADPSVSGSMGAQHATELASSAAGDGHAEIP